MLTLSQILKVGRMRNQCDDREGAPERPVLHEPTGTEEVIRLRLRHVLTENGDITTVADHDPDTAA